MSTKLILGASAIFMGALGIAATFAPHELLAYAGITPTNALALLVQLHAALLFGFAMTNWLARGSLIGGIYNRPLAVGNLAHFVIGALALVKAVGGGVRTPFFLVLALVYVVFAVAFGLILFRSPVASV